MQSKRAPHHSFVLAALLLVPLIGARPACAQHSVASATLSGRVEDASGAAVRAATITITNIDKNQIGATSSDELGRFRFLYLAVGSYDLKVEHDGFASAARTLTLSVGQALDLPLRLYPAGVDERVNISSEAPLIETIRTQVGETVAPAAVDRLPLNGRNYTDLALLIPAVSKTNTGSNQRFAETSAVPGTGISVAGQRNLNNGFVLDGLSANDDAAGLAGTFYSQEVIREFQVITSGGIAEFGRASSGVINIISQSGTKDWRGRLYGFVRNQRFDARNPLAPRKDSLTQAQYGASAGGPVVHGRTFLFSNFEQTRRNDSLVITISPSNLTAINDTLSGFHFRGPRIETGIVPSGFDSTNLFARVDDNTHASSNHFSARYSLYQVSAVNSRSVGGLNAISRGTNLEDLDQTIAVGDVTVLSSHSINEARFQYSRSRLEAPVQDAIGPAINISGIANFGTATFSPLARDVNLFEFLDNVATQRGKHSTKAGVHFLLNRVDILFPGAVQGVYTFTTLANFMGANYGSFQQAFGRQSQFQSNPNIGLFVQDEWRPHRDVTINAGVRYDAQFLPDPINTDANNFAPRLGLAFAPANHKTVIRASYGIYFDRIPLRATSNALQRDGSKYLVIQLSAGQPGAPVFPGVLSSVPDNLATRPNITRMDPNIKNSYGQQASLQIEREMSWHSSVSVGYIYFRGLHLILSRNVNVPRFPASAGVPNLGRPDQNWGNISRFESSGESTYNGLIVSFNKRASSWGAIRVSYTLSKAIDNAGNFFFSTPQNNFDLRDDRGLSDNDQRHRMTISGWLEAPRGESKMRRAVAGLQLGCIFTYASPLPFNVLTGNDRNFDTSFNDRPVGVGRNTGRGFEFASLDLRLTRRFHLTEHLAIEALAEGFNTLNRTNLQVPNSTFGTGLLPAAGFGLPTAASDPRQIQFGLRVSY